VNTFSSLVLKMKCAWQFVKV